MASITLKKPSRACILAVILYLCSELLSLFALLFTKNPFSASSAGRSLTCTFPLKPLGPNRSSYSLQWDAETLEQLFNWGLESCVLFLIPRLFHIHCLNLVCTPLFTWSVPWAGCLSHARGLPAPSGWQPPINQGVSKGISLDTCTFCLCLRTHLSVFPEPEKTLCCLM